MLNEAQALGRGLSLYTDKTGPSPAMKEKLCVFVLCNNVQNLEL